MSKLSSFDGQEQAFKLYCTGMKCADIARTMNLVPNTLVSWKRRGKWDERIAQDPSIKSELPATIHSVDQTDNLMNDIKVKLVEALQNKDIKPTKWKDIIDTLLVMNRDVSPARRGQVKRDEIDVTDLDDKDLDKEIAELQRLNGNKVEDAEIVLGKDDVLEIVSE